MKSLNKINESSDLYKDLEQFLEDLGDIEIQWARRFLDYKLPILDNNTKEFLNITGGKRQNPLFDQSYLNVLKNFYDKFSNEQLGFLKFARVLWGVIGDLNERTKKSVTQECFFVSKAKNAWVWDYLSTDSKKFNIIDLKKELELSFGKNNIIHNENEGKIYCKYK